MLKKGAFYVAGLIALYLVVQHGSASGQVITSGAAGASTFAKTLQGR